MKRFLVLLASFAACLGCAAAPDAPEGESIDLKTVEPRSLTVSVDGTPIAVTWYVDNYVARPNRAEDQLVNIYIPENATADSPIMLYVNNGGWTSNSYPTNTLTDGRDYNGQTDKAGVALKEGYVIVSYGGRSRANEPVDGKYLGHSPSIMTDTKAVVRYLRFNKKALPAGDTEKIIVTGTSGGGALSTVVAASGNSPDYYPSLYEIGAAGITLQADGTYVSAPGYGDNVFGVIAYCPITDLGHACAAYEWLYGNTRKAMYADGTMSYPYADAATILETSDALAAMYGPYVDGLGLKDDAGQAITAGNLRDYIAALMREEIGKSIEEFGVEQMTKDVEQEIRRRGFGGPMGGRGGQGGQRGSGGFQPGQQRGPGGQPAVQQATEYRVNNGWLVFNADGSFTYDLDKHLSYLARYTTLKVAPAFSNTGLYGNAQSEDTLFGSESDPYSPFNAYAWEHDSQANQVGRDDTGLSWEAFLQTEDGRRLALQVKMASAIDYLIEGKSDTAPFWYVRHGMDDRDTSFAVEATLFAAVKNSAKVSDANVGFAWLRPHSGDYDVPEAYAWLKGILK
ncbi:MAG: hypothetical protein J6S66_06655 [Bacteroidales bacterium]|nr:hypothetical protein [Bacteroidales bacterium]